VEKGFQIFLQVKQALMIKLWPSLDYRLFFANAAYA